jgi:hypothetical protein
MTKTKCVAVIPGCKQCEIQTSVKAKDHKCYKLCNMIARYLENEEFHRIWHEPETCGECGELLDDKKGESFYAIRTCNNGKCHVMACPKCDLEWMSLGPIGCEHEPKIRM